jgi:hypothetical protein
LIHGGITKDQWPDYLKEILRILIPGTGWAQFFEFDFPFGISKSRVLPKDAALNKAGTPCDWQLMTRSCIFGCKKT